MANMFVEPLPVRSEDELIASSPIISASTPNHMRRFTLTSGQTFPPSLFTASPLTQVFQGSRSRAQSIDVSHEAFALNNLSASLCNDSGINECSFGIPAKSRKCLNKELLDETPPGALLFDEEEELAQSDDEGAGPHKRGLSDSYRALKEQSPSTQKSKRASTDILPKVPNCMDASYSDIPLIGDNSREYLLPYEPHCNQEHCDFKCISPGTMADLVSGKFDEKVEESLIVDTRYPYEYDGGHIDGAVNVTTKEEMSKQYLENATINSCRQVVIFHCEFSSKRGPRMCRYVRDQDRLINTPRYPHLYYPEMYILHGGYRDFYPLYPELCIPQAYLEMLDPAFEEQCASWQKTTKQVAGNIGQSTVKALKTKTRSSRQLMLS